MDFPEINEIISIWPGEDSNFTCLKEWTMCYSTNQLASAVAVRRTQEFDIVRGVIYSSQDCSCVALHLIVEGETRQPYIAFNVLSLNLMLVTQI